MTTSPVSVTIHRIEGLRLEPHADPAQARVVIQHSDHTHGWSDIQMGLLDALYLLNLLEAMSAEQSLDHLRKPPSGAAQ